MDRLACALVLVALCHLGTAYGKNPRDEYLARWLRVYGELATAPGLSAEVARNSMDRANGKDFVFPEPSFNCDIQKSPTPPKTVHELRPSDINVIGALGDSVTAAHGVGAENILEVIFQHRGEAWSVGGDKSLDEGVITLANLLRKFNPGLKGWSRCSSFSDDSRAGLNVAEAGATSIDMPEQAEYLIEKLIATPELSLEDDWKMVTILIGGNDLCAACKNDEYHAPTYAKRISEALDILHAGLPRTIVNLVPMFDISPLGDFEGILCSITHLFICQCAVDQQYRNETSYRQRAYYRELQTLVDSGKYDSDTFTVVMQPVMVELTPPKDPDTGKYERGFLTHDCFHPSRMAHQGFAYMVWQSMMHPVGEKPLTWDLYDPNPVYKCPTEENPYIFTRGNSGTHSTEKLHIERENEI